LARARTHFDRGQELFAAGEYESAIPAYVAAFCAVPAPEPLFNVAQAHANLVDYERAVRWFELYLRALPDDATEKRQSVTNRLERLRRLPARVRVASDPPGATVTLDPRAGGASITGAAGGEPLFVPAGAYQLRLTLAQHEPIEAVIEPRIGQPYTFFYQLKHQTGTLRIVTRPARAHVVVNDRLLPGSGVHHERVSIGRHTVQVSADGFISEQRTVDVRAHETAALAITLPARPPNGRWLLIGELGVVGTIVGGGIASAVDVDWNGFGALAGLAASTAAGYRFLPERVPSGQASYLVGAPLLGALLGSSLDALLFDDARPLTLTLPLAATTGALFTFRRARPDAGRAALLNSGMLWGAASGYALATVVSRDLDRATEGRAKTSLRGALLLTGTTTGILTAGLLTRHVEISRERVWLIDAGGIIGLLIAASAARAVSATTNDITLPENTELYGLIGAGAGLITAALLTRRHDEPASLDEPAPRLTPSLSTMRRPDGTTVPLLGVAGSF
ncbi:MAG: PEGA domain-containing protein, partial [Myxococcales bacterium]|nr:PEGA domain-containing protein [Myxococcales bacterium]